MIWGFVVVVVVVVVGTSELLSDFILVVGKDFAAKFVSLWPHLLTIIKSNPGDEVRASVCGLIGRV